MRLTIVNQDILNLDMEKYYIAHCISGDFTLGAGLAKKINDKYEKAENEKIKNNKKGSKK